MITQVGNKSDLQRGRRYRIVYGRHQQSYTNIHIYEYIYDQNPVQMNVNMITDQYVHDQSDHFYRYLAANDGDWLERDFPKDVIPVCEIRSMAQYLPHSRRHNYKNYGATLIWQKKS